MTKSRSERYLHTDSYCPEDLRSGGPTPLHRATDEKPCGERHPLPCALDEDCPVPVRYFDGRYSSELIVESYQEAEEACR